jgi:hypothetical protein
MPPQTINTWLVTPAAWSDARKATTGAMFSAAPELLANNGNGAITEGTPPGDDPNWPQYRHRE